MNKEKEIMSANLIFVGQRFMDLVNMNKPSEASGVGSYNIVFTGIVFFSWDKATIGDIFDT